MVYTKKCSGCGFVRAIDDFCYDKSSSSGFNCYCRECTKEKGEIYYKENKDKIEIYSSEYRKKNAKKINALSSRWHRENRVINRDKYRQRRSEYQRKYLASNKSQRVAKILRCRIYNAMKGVAKSEKTISLLGCNFDEFLIYLESKFTDGMTWDNYGLHGWHIDHIRPCASFDLTDPEQQKECFNYKNMQPLWGVDNMSKSSKWDGCEKKELNVELTS